MHVESGKKYRPTKDMKEELRVALTTRALELKSETEAAAGSAATEHAETEVRADDALSETDTGSVEVVVESSATKHAGAEFCIEDALAEAFRGIRAIHRDFDMLVRVVDHACQSV